MADGFTPDQREEYIDKLRSYSDWQLDNEPSRAHSYLGDPAFRIFNQAWKEAKELIEREKIRRSEPYCDGEAVDIAALIWQARDEQ